MVRIAICDDRDYYVQIISVMVRQWANQKCLRLQLETFQSGEEVLWAAEEGGSFQAVFMDVELAGISGIEAAAGLRQLYRYTSVIFISQYDNYFRQMLEVHPCYYLEKPIPKKKLFEILDRIMEEHQYVYATYTYWYKRRSHSIFLRKVLYFTSEMRRIRIVMEDGRECMFYMKLDNVEKQLADYEVDFIRIHQSFLVNSRQVEQFYADHVMMSNGEKLSVSRGRRENINRFHRNVLERNTESYM